MTMFLLGLLFLCFIAILLNIPASKRSDWAYRIEIHHGIQGIPECFYSMEYPIFFQGWWTFRDADTGRLVYVWDGFPRLLSAVPRNIVKNPKQKPENEENGEPIEIFLPEHLDNDK